MKKFLLLLLVVLFAFTACDNSVKSTPLTLPNFDGDPLTIEFTADGGTVTIKNAPKSGLWYSLNGGEKILFNGSILSAQSGDKISLYAYETGNESKDRDFLNITCVGDCNVSGDITSLLVRTNNVTKNVFRELFKGNIGIKSVEGLKLPTTTTMAENCYDSMFMNCPNLQTAPINLSADNLAVQCYKSMFQDCASLETAPELPATTLAVGCYQRMFQECRNLTKAPELQATKLAGSNYNGGCYESMFQDCIKLKQAPALPATTLAESCYEGMFRGCTSLETAPVLPATILKSSCYERMFYECKNLKAAPKLPATKLSRSCYSDMFHGCTSLSEAPELSATTLEYMCYNGMFQGCKSLTQAPTLPATTLAEYCYEYMFSGCTSLTQAPELPATDLTGADGCYKNMFENCTKLESLTCLASPAPTDIRYTQTWLSGAGTGVENKKPVFYHAKGIEWPKNNEKYGIPDGWEQKDKAN